ncbi:hypothetical protein BGX28_000581 [Mortierella sp. GBA30]|nr:hypothetical protein BGX28_000581 [Mortierella sp. GBA30]
MKRKPCPKVAEEIKHVLETGEPLTKDNPGFEATRTMPKDIPDALTPTADETVVDQDYNEFDILDKNDRALKRAIDVLSEAREDIQRLRQQLKNR